MKTIEVSDKDYEILMMLSKELQTQENDCQAFPYYWEPSSIRRVRDDDSGEIIKIYHDCESFDLDDYIEAYPEVFASYLESEGMEKVEFSLNVDGRKFAQYVDDTEPDAQIYGETEEHKSEHNMSFFKSDVKQFCESNKHHLGKEPHTYARTSWRMPKMEAIVKCLCRINKDVPQDDINNEIKYRVFNWKGTKK